MKAATSAELAGPAEIWASLAQHLAARKSMRIWRGPASGFDRSVPLATVNLPKLPAALPLFNRHGRTSILGLDFDTKRCGRHQVEKDVADAVDLIRGVGGLVVVDRSSTSGGMHVWVPLWSEATHRPAHLRPLLDAMAARWPSLDITPMLGPATGCLTGPGSATREGGHRQLLTPLDDAMKAVRERCPMGTLAKIKSALDVVDAPSSDQTPPRASKPEATAPTVQGSEALSAGAPEPLPAHVEAYATHGILPSHRRTAAGASWTHSEARQSVLAHCAVRSWDLDMVRSEINAGRWPGLQAAYDRYGRRWESRLQADWIKALNWAKSAISKFRVFGHEQEHTGGAGELRLWLARALRWVDLATPLEGQTRSTAYAVIQAMAYAARISRNKTPAMGRRWLSIAAGMLDDGTVSETLRVLRDLDGSPLLLIESHAGRSADKYALVTARIDGEDVVPSDAEVARARVEPVAAVWGVIGHAARAVFERLEAAQRTEPGARSQVANLISAGVQGQTQVYAALRKLAEFGLIERGRGWVRRTARTLQDVADEHQVADWRADRIERFRTERSAWQRLLSLWNAEAAEACPKAERLPQDPMPADERAAWLAAVIAAGPPDDPFELDDPAAVDDVAIHLLTDFLGARIIDDSLAPVRG